MQLAGWAERQATRAQTGTQALAKMSRRLKTQELLSYLLELLRQELSAAHMN